MTDGSSGSSFDNFYSICGFLGGVVFTASLIPQLIKTWRTKSTKDLSYLWQTLYIIGLIGLSVYGVYYQLWPLAGPLFVELALLISLMAMKVVFDNFPVGADGVVREMEEVVKGGQEMEASHVGRQDCENPT